MIKCEQSEIYSDSFQGLHFARSTLSPKIIQLRRVSQGNHIRRMRMAYLKKEMQEPLDKSSYISPFPKRHLSCLQTPFTSSAATKSTANIERDNNKENSGSFKLGDISPKYSENPKKLREPEEQIQNEEGHNNLRLSSTPVFPKCETPVLRLRKKLTPNTVSKKDICLDVNIKKSLSYSSINKEDQEPLKEYKTLKYGFKISTPSNQISETDKMKSDKSKDKILTDHSNDNKQMKGYTKNCLDSSKLSASKIPISVSRISIKSEKKNDLLCSRGSDKTKKYFDSTGSKRCNQQQEKMNELKDINKSLSKPNNDLNLVEKTSDFVNDDSVIKDTKNIPLGKLLNGGDLQQSNDCYQISTTKRSSITKWLSDIIISDNNEKNCNCSHVTTNDERSIEPSTVDKSPKSPILRIENLDFKSSEISNKKCSDSSEESLESLQSSYYDPEDTEDNMNFNKSIDSREKWMAEKFEDDSTVTIPSDKELDVESHREAMFRNLPDYPNTPYFLRYPRYRSKETNNFYKSCELEAGDGVRLRKSRKNLKRFCNSTPRRKNSGRKKINLKAKKQISKLRELSE